MLGEISSLRDTTWITSSRTLTQPPSTQPPSLFTVNRIKPGTIRRVETSKMPFKQMENISNFLKACRTLGVAEHDLFETVDLFEGKDLGVVVTCIHALGRTVQTTCPDFRGPHLGAKMSGNSKASFRQGGTGGAVKKENNYGLSKFAVGSSKTMQKAGFNDTKSITFGADTVGIGSTSTVSQQSQGSVSTMQRSEISKSKDITFGYKSGNRKPPEPPPRRWGSNQPTQSRSRAVSNTKPSAPASQTPTKEKGMARGGGYGLDAELAKKMALKYDVGLEREAAAWIESVTGGDMSGDFAGALKDGQILCKLGENRGTFFVGVNKVLRCPLTRYFSCSPFGPQSTKSARVLSARLGFQKCPSSRWRIYLTSSRPAAASVSPSTTCLRLLTFTRRKTWESSLLVSTLLGGPRRRRDSGGPSWGRSRPRRMLGPSSQAQRQRAKEPSHYLTWGATGRWRGAR